MKKFIALMVVIVFLSSSCTSKQSDNTVTDITIFVDNTDKKPENREGLVSTKALTDLLGYNGQMKWKLLTAVALNPDTTIQISLPEDPTSAQKKDALDPVEASIDNLRKRYLSLTTGAGASNIYKPVCEAVQMLSHSKANKKVLIIVSDMIENSEYGKFYELKGKDYKDVKKRLATCNDSLPKNPGVKVIIVFDPKGKVAKETEFRQAMGIWEKLFKEANIVHEVKPNL